MSSKDGEEVGLRSNAPSFPSISELQEVNRQLEKSHNYILNLNEDIQLENGKLRRQMKSLVNVSVVGMYMNRFGMLLQDKKDLLDDIKHMKKMQDSKIENLPSAVEAFRMQQQRLQTVVSWRWGDIIPFLNSLKPAETRQRRVRRLFAETTGLREHFR